MGHHICFSSTCTDALQRHGRCQIAEQSLAQVHWRLHLQSAEGASNMDTCEVLCTSQMHCALNVNSAFLSGYMIVGAHM
jgi:hypothetical protein